MLGTRFYRRLVRALFIINVAAAGYIVFAPLLPQVWFYLHRVFIPLPTDTVVSMPSASLTNQDALQEQTEVVPEENTIVIPKIGVDGRVHEGKSLATLNKGVWRRPRSSTPDKGGNTVFVAHRFLYTSGPNTFYHLDKLTQGDRFVIFWEKKRYVYEVTETRIVLPEELDIEAPTREPVLTLYTCTPLFTADKRLVVRAKVIEGI